jgi:hypothetical protein
MPVDETVIWGQTKSLLQFLGFMYSQEIRLYSFIHLGACSLSHVVNRKCPRSLFIFTVPLDETRVLGHQEFCLQELLYIVGISVIRSKLRI